MVQQKLLNSLDEIEQLLKIANEPKTKKVKKTKANPEIDNFIIENNILSGKKRISTYIIYYKYYMWKHKRLINRKKFFNYFKTKFEKTRTIDGVGYLLNPKGFDMTPGGYFRARKLLREENEKK